MVVKTIKKAKFDIDGYEEEYFGNVKEIKRFNPCLNQKEEVADTLELKFEDSSSMLLVLGMVCNESYAKKYNSVFLMNDNGETIERLI